MRIGTSKSENLSDPISKNNRLKADDLPPTVHLKSGVQKKNLSNVAKMILTSLTLSTLLTSCTTVTTSQYDATALVSYTWQVEYLRDSEGRRQRFEKFASSSLLNQNGLRPDDAVTGPDDQGLWWPALPPRPTVDEMEEKQQGQERIGTPTLIKSVDYSLSFDMNGQPRILPTNYSVYRQVVKAYPDQRPLELTLGVNDGSVEKADPQ